MEDVIQYLKKLQGLMERSVNGNQQTHNLLNSMNDNSKRSEQLIERIATATEGLQTNSQHMGQLLESIMTSNQHMEQMMEQMIIMYGQISQEVYGPKIKR